MIKVSTKRENAKRERRRRQRRQIRENFFFVAYLHHTQHTTHHTQHKHNTTQTWVKFSRFFLLFSFHTCPSVNNTTCVSLFFSFPFSFSFSSKHTRRGANRFVPWDVVCDEADGERRKTTHIHFHSASLCTSHICFTLLNPLFCLLYVVLCVMKRRRKQRRNRRTKS